MKNSDSNIKEYKEAHHLADQLIETVLISSDSEQDGALQNFLHDEAMVFELKERFDNYKTVQQNFQTLTAKKEENISKLIKRMNCVQKKQHRKMVQRKILSTGAIAAALLILSFLLWPHLTPQEQKFYTVENTINKTISVPTLLVGDETLIALTAVTVGDPLGDFADISERGIHYTASTEERKVVYNTVIVPAGYTYDVELADGSKITVNAGSELRYPVPFSGNVREVELKGEAYFDITKSNRPMVIKVGTSLVKVYGTKFTINQYSSCELVETVLLEGSIGMTNSGMEEFLLQPNQRAVYNSKSGEIDVSEVDAENYIAWREGVFKYSHTNVLKVLDDISRWYGVRFEVHKNLTSCMLTLNVNKDMTIEQIISSLELMLDGVRFIREEGGLYVIE